MNPIETYRVLQAFRRDAIALFTRRDLYERGVLDIDFGLRPGRVVADPAAAIGILTSPVFDKGDEAYGPLGTFKGFGSLRWLIGPTLPVLDGEAGLARRRLLRPVYQGVLQRLAEAQASTPLALPPVEGTVDLYDHLSVAVFQRFCEAMFGRAYPEHAAAISETVSIATTCLDALSKSWVPYVDRFGAAGRTIRRCREHLLAFAETVRADLATGDAPMSRLLGSGLDDPAILDEIVTQIVAGTETTSITTSWAMVALTQHPAWVARLREEGDAAATLVTKEVLRLYPAFWTLIRVPRQDTEVAGFSFPKDAVTFVSPWAVHHNPNVWPDPERFDPERFVDRTPVRGDYLPFGYGARACIGGRLAQAIAQECLLEATRRMDLAFVPSEPDGPEIDPLIVVLKSRTGFRFQVTPRSAGTAHRGTPADGPA